jgi:hypothetical protein
MTNSSYAIDPPNTYFPNIIYNSSFFNNNNVLTQTNADNSYFRKIGIAVSTATSNTFNGLMYIYNTLTVNQIICSVYNSLNISDTINFFTNSTGIINMSSNNGIINNHGQNVFDITPIINDNLSISNNICNGGEMNCNNLLTNNITCRNIKITNDINIATSMITNIPINSTVIRGYFKFNSNGIEYFIPCYK